MVHEACERAAGEEQGNSQARGLPDILDLNATPPCIAEQTQLEAPGEALTLHRAAGSKTSLYSSLLAACAAVYAGLQALLISCN